MHARHPAGSPASVGGQFATTSRTESEAQLEDTSCDDVCASCGSPIGIDASGASHHLDRDGDTDYDADADHVALSQRLYDEANPAPTDTELPALDSDKVVEAFRTALADRIEREASDDPWADRQAWNEYLKDLRSTHCWVVDDHTVAARTPGIHNYVAAEVLDRASGNFTVDETASINEQPDGSYTVTWQQHAVDKPRDIDDNDRQVATTIYEQIGLLAAGNMDAKARLAETIPNGIRMRECRMGRKRERVDVTVRLNGADLYDVDVVTSRTLRSDGGRLVFATKDVAASDIRGLMFDIGDNNPDKLAGWQG